MNSRSFLIFALVVLAIFHSGEALKCYQCNAGSGESCAKKFESKHEYDCDSDIDNVLPFCLACTVHFHNGTNFIHRHCANQLTYKKLPQCVESTVKFMECKTCNEDFCNGASTNVLTWGWLGLLWVIRSMFAGAY